MSFFPGRLHLPGSVGTEVYGTRSTLLDVDDDGVGEICANSRTVVMGYHKYEGEKGRRVAKSTSSMRLFPFPPPPPSPISKG